MPTTSSLAAASAPFPVPSNVRQEALRWGDGSATSAVFRYRADGVATGSPCGITSCGVTAVGAPTAHTVTRPAPFRNFQSTTFNGTTQAILGPAAISTQTTLGFTVIAWFRVPTGNTENAKLFSNTENNDGFALDVNSGYLAGTYSYEPTGNTTPQRHTYTEASSGPKINDGKWHEAAFVVARMPEGFQGAGGAGGPGPTARARLFLDGAQLGSDYLTATGKDFSFLDSTSLPAVGAEPNGNVPAANFFAGDINAVEVYNYPVDYNVLAIAPPWDGDDVYGGLPDYHDYLVYPESDGTGTPNYEGNTWSYAHRFTNTDRNASWPGTALETVRVAIPMIDAGYVPQGVAVSSDGSKMYTMSHYSDDSDDGTCPTSACYALAVTDLTTMKVTGIYELNLPGDHAGGVVLADGYVYTGFGTTIYRFGLSQAVVVAAADTANNIPAIYSLAYNNSYNWGSAYPNSSASALAYNPVDNSIYAEGYYEPEKGDNVAANDILRMPLGTDGSVGAIAAVYAVPTTEGHNQGMLPDGTVAGKQCFLLSHSDNFAPVNGNPTTMQQETSYLDHWCDGSSTVTTVTTLAGGAENITLGPDNMLWVQSENAAHLYQKRTSAVQYWDRFTPYVAGIPLGSL